MICNCCIVNDLLCCFVTHYQKQSTTTSVELSASSFIDPALCLMNIRALPLDQYVLQLSYYLHLLIILTSKLSLSVSSSSFSLKYCLSFTFFFTTTAYPKRKQLNGGRFYLWLQFQGICRKGCGRRWEMHGGRNRKWLVTSPLYTGMSLNRKCGQAIKPQDLPPATQFLQQCPTS